MGDSRIHRLVRLIEALEKVQPLGSTFKFDDKEPTSADEDALQLLPGLRLREMSTFTGVERRTYADLCASLTRQMHALAAGVEDIEGGLIVADSRWPQEVRGWITYYEYKHIAERASFLDGWDNYARGSSQLGVHYRFLKS